MDRVLGVKRLIMEDKRDCIAFAYYGDNKLIGFHSDTWGSITNYPKIYGNSERQIEVIATNFRHKMSTFNSDGAITIGKLSPPAGAVLTKAMNQDRNILSNYKDIELRVIPAPYFGSDDDYQYPKEEVEIWRDNLPEAIRIIKYIPANE